MIFFFFGVSVNVIEPILVSAWHWIHQVVGLSGYLRLFLKMHYYKMVQICKSTLLSYRQETTRIECIYVIIPVFFFSSVLITSYKKKLTIFGRLHIKVGRHKVTVANVGIMHATLESKGQLPVISRDGQHTKLHQYLLLARCYSKDNCDTFITAIGFLVIRYKFIYT